MILLFIIGLALIFGWMCSRVALFKDKDPKFWFLMGLLFGFTALVIIFLISAEKKEKPQQATLAKEPKQPPLPFRRWYFLNEKHETEGPLSSYALQAILQEGKISPSTYVWNEEMVNWQPLSDVWPDAST